MADSSERVRNRYRAEGVLSDSGHTSRVESPAVLLRISRTFLARSPLDTMQADHVEDGAEQTQPARHAQYDTQPGGAELMHRTGCSAGKRTAREAVRGGGCADTYSGHSAMWEPADGGDFVCSREDLAFARSRYAAAHPAVLAIESCALHSRRCLR
jgi:hypothetical protein